MFGRSPSVTLDAHGNPETLEDAGTTYSAYLEQTEAKEIVVGRDTQVSDHLLVLPKGTEIDDDDEIVINGVRYIVVGPPWHAFTPTGEHHVECRLRLTTG